MELVNEFVNNWMINVNKCRVPGWGSRDHHYRWLEISNDMAQNRLEWGKCTHSLSFYKFWALEFLITFFYPVNVYFLFESYLRFLIFPITSDTATTSTNLGLSLTISSLCTNGAWQLEPMYIHAKLYVASDRKANWKNQNNPTIKVRHFVCANKYPLTKMLESQIILLVNDNPVAFVEPKSIVKWFLVNKCTD